MKKVVIIGGGLAGFSAALHLQSKNIKSVIIEAAGSPGGRTFSFPFKPTGDAVDNGQHLLMGCYRDTLEYLSMVGTRNKLYERKRLRVPVIDGAGKAYLLAAPAIPYPFSLSTALLKYKALSFKDRLRIIKFAAGLFFTNPDTIRRLSVAEWLAEKGQNAAIRKYLWDIIAIGALNCDPGEASAATFTTILKEIFFKGNYAAALLVPSVNLKQLFFEGAITRIESAGGQVHLGERVKSFSIEDNRLSGIETTKRIIEDFDFVIAAVPYYSLQKIKGYEYLFDKELPEQKYRSILSFHFWLKENPLTERMTGLPDSPLQWVFNHDAYISTVISNADRYRSMKPEEKYWLVLNELEKYFGISSDDILHYKLLHEKRATFVPSTEMDVNRPGHKTALKNVLLAGDWIGTRFPATIEAAVRSGKQAAGSISHND